MLGTWFGKSLLLIPVRHSPFLTLSATFPCVENARENIWINKTLSRCHVSGNSYDFTKFKKKNRRLHLCKYMMI